MARFFLPRTNLRDSRATLTGPELEHMRRVLRMGVGDRVVVFDEEGWEHEGVIDVLKDDCGELRIIRSHRPENESPLHMTLALALTKGEKMDFVVEKATELGVAAIAPFVSMHTVPRLDAKKAAQRGLRWRKIALSAAKQCGRTRIPEVFELSDFRSVLAGAPDALRLLFWEQEPRRGLADLKRDHSDVSAAVLVIGPEGGFSEQEAALALEHGFTPVRLGRRILRAETAALAALSAVQILWGDFR